VQVDSRLNLYPAAANLLFRASIRRRLAPCGRRVTHDRTGLERGGLAQEIGFAGWRSGVIEPLQTAFIERFERLGRAPPQVAFLV
jgi:hypothetical protein